jgi:hypothetical protein
VFASERVCPFCQRALAPVQELPVMVIPSGISRAQRLALAAAIAGQALAGCAETATPIYGAPVPVSGQGATAGTGGAGTGPAGMGSPAGRGGAGARSAGIGGGGEGGFIALPPYGVPLAGNPALDDDAGVADDAGPTRDSGQMASPVYGAPVYGAPPTPKD